ncbi:MAG: uroporphyrinogen-III synthase [Methylotenera sp.]|nr:uroporphyrinogen-III synthase [Methylotenera sp.]
MVHDALTGLHIAVTRPAEQAADLCLAIAAQGGVAIDYPLLAIAALDDYSGFDQAIAGLASADWAIFISSNAVDYAMPRVIKRFGQLPKPLQFAGIGPQTAQHLAKFGVDQVLMPHTRFDTEALLALAPMQSVANKNIVIFRGLGGREVLAETLKSRGARVTFAESYRRYNPQKNALLLEQKWQQGELDAVVVTSSEAMRNLIQLAGQAPWLKNVRLCVNHARIAELPISMGLKVNVAKAPGDAAMLDCLANLRPH